MWVGASYGSPVIWPSDVLLRALVDHGLDGEDVACFHESGYFAVAIMRDGWNCME